MSKPADDGEAQITRLLAAAADGDGSAAGRLLPLVYDQLRRMAARRMSNERADHTLQATALVHEAYLRLVGSDPAAAAAAPAGRGQFFAAAATAMRRVLVDHARSRAQLKRGGDRIRLPSSVLDLAAADEPDTVLAVDEALAKLEQRSPDVAEVVRLRFFAGLSIDETAEATGKSPRSVKRDWTYARAWLSEELGGGDRAPAVSSDR